jgi:hypothetical protein
MRLHVTLTLSLTNHMCSIVNQVSSFGRRRGVAEGGNLSSNAG